MITQTPRGSSIQRVESGKFLVCDSEQSCFVARSLFLAEEQLEVMEHGYSFPLLNRLPPSPDRLKGLCGLGNRALLTGIKTY